MKYRVTCHRRTLDTQAKGPMRGHNYKLLEPLSFNADTLAEMRAAVLKAQGTRFAFKVTVSVYLAAFVQTHDGEWIEVNP